MSDLLNKLANASALALGEIHEPAPELSEGDDFDMDTDTDGEDYRPSHTSSPLPTPIVNPTNVIPTTPPVAHPIKTPSRATTRHGTRSSTVAKGIGGANRAPIPEPPDKPKKRKPTTDPKPKPSKRTAKASTKQTSQSADPSPELSKTPTVIGDPLPVPSVQQPPDLKKLVSKEYDNFTNYQRSLLTNMEGFIIAFIKQLPDQSLVQDYIRGVYTFIATPWKVPVTLGEKAAVLLLDELLPGADVVINMLDSIIKKKGKWGLLSDDERTLILLLSVPRAHAWPDVARFYKVGYLEYFLFADLPPDQKLALKAGICQMWMQKFIANSELIPTTNEMILIAYQASRHDGVTGDIRSESAGIYLQTQLHAAMVALATTNKELMASKLAMDQAILEFKSVTKAIDTKIDRAAASSQHVLALLGGLDFNKSIPKAINTELALEQIHSSLSALAPTHSSTSQVFVTTPHSSVTSVPGTVPPLIMPQTTIRATTTTKPTKLAIGKSRKLP